MKSCTRVKNPCKICLQTVTNKTGLQCKGACKRWAHFTCLNYTPGKIQDIKAGLIIVTCPCPTCNTVDPKEYITNPPFTCDSRKCPANLKPKCEKTTCPTNMSKPIPEFTRSDLLSTSGNSNESDPVPCASNPAPASLTSTCSPPLQPALDVPTDPCKDEVKNIDVQPQGENPCVKSVVRPTKIPKRTVNGSKISDNRGNRIERKEKTHVDGQENCKKNQDQQKSHKKDSLGTEKDCICKPGKICKVSNAEEKGSTETTDRDRKQEDIDKCGRIDDSELGAEKLRSECQPRETEENLKTVGKTLSCACLSTTSDLSGPQLKSNGIEAEHIKSSSDSALFKESQKALICTIQQLCSTVGQLSNQVKELMCKMLDSLETK